MKKLTVRVKPYDGESLFSFILRFSKENGIEFISFWKLFQKKKTSHYLQLNDIEVLNFVPINVIDTLKFAQVTGLNTEEINKMSFYFILKTFCCDNNLERSRFMSNLIREEYYYCPCCLRDRPYHRLIWAFKEINTCTIHEAKLEDKCDCCKRSILIKDLKTLDICPYCGNKLSKKGLKNLCKSDKSFLKGKWVNSAFEILTSSTECQIKPQDVAIRLLYVLNSFNGVFERDTVKKALKEKSKTLPTLLQHARQSLNQKRTLHLSYVFSVLYQNNVSISDFFAMEVPLDFISSLMEKPASKKDNVSCIAPWCSSYLKNGSMVKTGTSYSTRKSGSILKYFLVCSECGCEYAFDDKGVLKERMYFIQGYEILRKYAYQNFSLRELSRKTNFSLDRLKRCISYFNSRGINFGYGCDIVLSRLTLDKLLEALKAKKNIKEIEKWPTWQSHNEFLFYRFHKDVIHQIIKKEESKAFLKKNDLSTNRNSIESILNRMIEMDDDITVGNVCKEAGICPETLRYWGLNSLVSEIKHKQKVNRFIRNENKIILKKQQFFEDNENELVITKDLYQHLGISRNILWRSNPEMTASIHEQVKNHNKTVRQRLN